MTTLHQLLFMVNPSDITDVFPFTLLDNGLPYEQPEQKYVVALMWKVAVLIGEEHKEFLQTMEKVVTSKDVIVNDLDDKTNSRSKKSNKATVRTALPLKTKSVRVMTLAGSSKVGTHQSAAGNVSSTNASALKQSNVRSNKKRVSSRMIEDDAPLPITNKLLPKQHESIKKTAPPAHDCPTESALMVMTNAELLQLCNRFKVEVPIRCKKSVMVDGLLNRGGAHLSSEQ